MVAAVLSVNGFDGTIHDWVLDHRAGALTSIWRVVTDLGGAAVLVPLTMLAVVLLVVAHRPWLGLFVALAGVGGLVLQHVLKGVFARPRPPRADWLVHAGGWSFPSGHALQAAAAYLALAVVLSMLVSTGRLRTVVWSVALALTLLVGASRVYLGVHWPTDVLAGWAIGALWVTVLVVLLRPRFGRSPTEVEG